MVWQIKPFSHRCFVSATPFEDGDTYVSYLVVDKSKELQRFDVSAEAAKDFTPEGELLCRWRQIYKKEPEKDNSARRQKETAEGLFLSLYEEESDETSEADEETGETEVEREILKQFLSLLLERKRVLRPRGKTPDGQFRLYEHAKSKAIYAVPAGKLGAEELMQISDRLAELVQGP